MFDMMNKIGEDIYVYPNFISILQCNAISNYLDELKDAEWNIEDIIDTTGSLDSIESVRLSIEKILPENLYIGPGASAIRMRKGKHWGEHSDMHSFREIERNSLSYVEGSPFKEEYLPTHGAVVYFNQFEGGQLYYPKQSVFYHPNPGDLVIHGAGDRCMHGVTEVISEKRYSYTNLIYKRVRVSV